MNLYLSALVNKIFYNQFIYFFYEKYYLNNSIFILVFKKSLIYVLYLLKYNTFFRPTIFLELSAFDFFNDTNASDLPKFSLLYCIFMFMLSMRIFIFFLGSNDDKIFTSSYIYNNLFWSEREISEMHNIQFLNKNDSRHLLLDYSINGNPMLKNYSLIGYSELLYNFIIFNVIYINLMLLESTKINNNFDY